MSAPPRRSRNPIVALIDYIITGLERTLVPSVRLTLPRKFVSPLGFLGVLTTVMFVILGITGAILMLYYQPTLLDAYQSVLRINEVTDKAGPAGQAVTGAIPYGFIMRNIHYHASNAMVLLALLHMYYQYFSGRFKIKNEILWASGVILGLFTVLEAYSGYDLIFNDRAVLAINIGFALTDSSPGLILVPGPLLRQILLGGTYAEAVLRLYSYHVFIVPVLLVLLMVVHFPRYLVFDIPMIAVFSGAILMVGGLFPVILSVPWEPQSAFIRITVPEWYVTPPYALLRTQYERFITGGLIPLLAVLATLGVAFVDRSKKLSWKDRPFFTAFGVASIAQSAVYLGWGFYTVELTKVGGNLLAALAIDPLPFFSVLLAVSVVSFALTYLFLRYIKAKETVKARKPGERVLFIRGKWVTGIILGIIGFQVVLNVLAFSAYSSCYSPPFFPCFRNLALFEFGTVIVLFGVLFHIYRYTKQFAQFQG